MKQFSVKYSDCPLAVKALRWQITSIHKGEFLFFCFFLFFLFYNSTLPTFISTHQWWVLCSINSNFGAAMLLLLFYSSLGQQQKETEQMPCSLSHPRFDCPDVNRAAMNHIIIYYFLWRIESQSFCIFWLVFSQVIAHRLQLFPKWLLNFSMRRSASTPSEAWKLFECDSF